MNILTNELAPQDVISPDFDSDKKEELVGERKPLRILFLEDDEMDFLLVSREAKRADASMEIYRVEDKEGFMEAIDSYEWDAVIGDYSLPDYDGLSALKYCQDRQPFLPFIFVTGTLGEEVAVEAMKQGAMDFVVKNHIKRLPGAITSAIELADERRKRKEAEESLRMLNLELESRVEKRTAELKKRNADLEAFNYSISHDLRTPLRTIHTYSYILQKNFYHELGEEGNEAIRYIGGYVKKMTNLLDDLLSFSKVSQDDLNNTPFKMCSLVKEVLDVFPESYFSGAESFHIQEMPKLCGDRRMFRHVVINLISNAFKYTDDKTDLNLEIGGYTSESGDQSIYYFKDNGIGFDMKYHDKIFTIFKRLHVNEVYEGSGVGLAIAKRVIEKHKGKIWAESTLGKGSTFFFSLPACVS